MKRRKFLLGGAASFAALSMFSRSAHSESRDAIVIIDGITYKGQIINGVKHNYRSRGDTPEIIDPGGPNGPSGPSGPGPSGPSGPGGEGPGAPQ